MAGRPLRRLRNALRLNPLVGWEDTSGMSAATAESPFVTLVKSGAEAKYEEVYNRVDLPIAVVLREQAWDGERGSVNLSRKTTTSTIRRAVSQHKKDAALAHKLRAILLVVAVPRRDGSPNEPRGSAGRVSPYTPFVLLHRLGDFLLRKSSSDRSEDLGQASKYLRDIEQKRFLMHPDAERYEVLGGDPALLSKGVDTAAGRMGVLVDVDSDLFAKWLLTGRLAYDPDSPPSETREERAYRSTLAKNLPRVFHLWHRYLQRSAPAVIYL